MDRETIHLLFHALTIVLPTSDQVGLVEYRIPLYSAGVKEIYLYICTHIDNDMSVGSRG